MNLNSRISYVPGTFCFGLLAGGQSRRMGVDKAMLPWNGQPLWKHQLRLATAIEADEVLVSGSADGPWRGAARVVPDAVSGHGPIAGLAAVLAAMRSDWLVLAAVDMPWLEAGMIRTLLTGCCGGAGVVPCLGDRVEPFAGIYPSRLAELAQRHAASGDRSLRNFVREAERRGCLKLISWEWKRAGSLKSINTPSEWADATTSRL